MENTPSLNAQSRGAERSRSMSRVAVRRHRAYAPPRRPMLGRKPGQPRLIRSMRRERWDRGLNPRHRRHMSAEFPLCRRCASAGHDGDRVGGHGRAGRARPGASRELEAAGRRADSGAGPSAAVDRGAGLDTRSLDGLLGRVPPPGTPASRTSPGGEPLEAIGISHPDPALPVSSALAVYSSVSARLSTSRPCLPARRGTFAAELSWARRSSRSARPLPRLPGRWTTARKQGSGWRWSPA